MNDTVSAKQKNFEETNRQHSISTQNKSLRSNLIELSCYYKLQKIFGNYHRYFFDVTLLQ